MLLQDLKTVDSRFFIDYADLDDMQRQLIDRRNSKHVVVCGSAGSGKSLIALHKAKQVSQLGSYAVIVYTKTLRKYFEDGLKSLGLSNVYHYNGWNKTNVKYLIVDECQDFSPEEISMMIKHAQICFFFGDTDQSIMKFRGALQSVEETAHELHVTLDQLYWNYRLTKDIARLAETVGKVEDLEYKCKRSGEKTNIIKARSIDDQLDKIIETIRNRQLTNVGILMPYNTIYTAQSACGNSKMSVEYVKNYLLRHSITCEFKYNANKDTEMDLDFHTTNPKVLTWWCAKGLQFDDVFVPCCDYEFDEDKRSALYVAITRCCERLYLTYSGTIGRFFPDPAKVKNIYKDNDDIEDI